MEYNDMLDAFTVNVLAGFSADAEAQFADLMDFKMGAVLDTEKKALAATLFNGTPIEDSEDAE